jgi:hypothetical protein
LLQLFGWAHRKGVLNLTLVLPDGSRSYIPASWTDLDPNILPDVKPQTAIIGSILHLLQARKVIDALLCKLDDYEQRPNPFKEGEQSCINNYPCGPKKSPSNPASGKISPPAAKTSSSPPWPE